MIFKKNKILIARRKPNISNSGKWEFPGGKIKENESLKKAIIREIDEEFGMAVFPQEVIGNIEALLNKELEINLIGIYCIAENDIKYMKDHDKYRWCDFDDLKNFDLSAADVNLLSCYEKKIKAIAKGIV